MKKSLLFGTTLASILLLSTNAFANTVASASSTIASSTASINASSPDSLIKGMVDNVVTSIKQHKLNQGQGQIKKISELIEDKIMPFADLEATTKMVMGPHWEKSTPEQRSLVMKEFKQLLIATYAGALSKVNDQQINYKPLRMLPTDTKAIVKSTIIDQGDTKSLDYRLHKVGNEWKIYDLNVLGIGFVARYKTDFNDQANKSGIDGLIKFLQAKNKK
jgi:phospholipid transport system substrate-binding protein